MTYRQRLITMHQQDSAGAVEVVSALITVEWVPGNAIGDFSGTPQGIILHSTRSGQPFDIEHEYQGTLNYIRSGASGLGWSATAGDYKLAYHMDPREWGWNARQHSYEYLAIEIAQAHLGDPVSDGQIAAVAAFYHKAKEVWPQLPATFPNHSDLPAGIADGKSDVEPRGQHSVRDRVLAAIGA